MRGEKRRGKGFAKVRVLSLSDGETYLIEGSAYTIAFSQRSGPWQRLDLGYVRSATAVRAFEIQRDFLERLGKEYEIRLEEVRTVRLTTGGK